MGIFDHTGGRPKPTPPPIAPTCGVALVVTDAQGGPVALATLTVGALTARSNRDGYHYFTGVPKSPAVVQVTVTKDGYVAYTGPYAFYGDNQDLPIELQSAAPPGPVLPPVPTRAQVCALQTSLQGLTYHTTQYGDFPAWFYPILSASDRVLARQDHALAVVPGRVGGDTHITIPISEAYEEGGVLWPDELKHGYDWSYNLEHLRAIVTEAIVAGFFIDMPLAGDGLSINDNPQQGEYNDPVGKTYGYEWLMANLPRIVAALKGDGTTQTPDLTPYIIFRPGWDAVFYGWGKRETPDLQPTRVRLFGELFRRLLPNGYLAIEHTPGNIPCGEGGGDFGPGGLMRHYDTILSEFNTVDEDSCWQVVARMVPHYTRPSNQPDGDDPNPPFYLKPGTERGPYFYVGFEPTTGGVYEWCRGKCTLSDVNAVRAKLRAMGVRYTG